MSERDLEGLVISFKPKHNNTLALENMPPHIRRWLKRLEGSPPVPVGTLCKYCGLRAEEGDALRVELTTGVMWHERCEPA